MALYVYKCPKCEKEKEISHGMLVDPEFKCEACGEVMFRKIQANPIHYHDYSIMKGTKISGGK